MKTIGAQYSVRDTPFHFGFVFLARLIRLNQLLSGPTRYQVCVALVRRVQGKSDFCPISLSEGPARSGQHVGMTHAECVVVVVLLVVVRALGACAIVLALAILILIALTVWEIIVSRRE